MADAGKKALEVTSEILKLAGENSDTREAGRAIAKSLRILAGTVRTALLPLEALNYAAARATAYFDARFDADLARRTEHIPEENVVAPPAAYAFSAIQALALVVDEPSLREAYLSLLASAIDDRNEQPHPAFIDILRQLTAEEASLLPAFVSQQAGDARGETMFAEARLRHANGRMDVLQRHIVSPATLQLAGVTGVPSERISLYIENWQRLGILDTTAFTTSYDTSEYLWVEATEEYRRLERTHSTADKVVYFMPGVLRPTTLGRAFASAADLRIFVRSPR